MSATAWYARGPRGAGVSSGAGVPAADSGEDGDFYVDTTSGDTYKKSGVTWAKTGNLRGPRGPDGPPGSFTGSAGVINALDHGADPTGAADSTVAFTAAVAALPGEGGWVYVPAGTYTVSSTIDLHEFQGIRGDGEAVTVINYTGTGPCINATLSSAWGGTGQPTGDPTPCGFRDFTIDGTNAGTGAVGLQLGNLFDSHGSNIFIQNFKTVGAVGLLFKNYGALPVVNRMKFTAITLINNSTGVIFDGGGTGIYQTYSYTVLHCYIKAGTSQNGLTLQNAAGLGGCDLRIGGNFQSASADNAGWVVGVNSGGSLTYARVFICVEPTVASGAKGHRSIVMAAGSYWKTTGPLYFGGVDNNAFQGAVIPVGAAFASSGSILDPVLSSSSLYDSHTFYGGVDRNVVAYGASQLVDGISLAATVCDVMDLHLPSHPLTIGGFAGEPYLTSRRLEMILRQPASGAPCVVTWPSNVKFTNTNTLSAVNGAVDKAILTYYPGDHVWYAEIFTGYASSPEFLMHDDLDMNGNAITGLPVNSIPANVIEPDIRTNTTTGGTTTLTVASAAYQSFAGTLGQTVVLPDATTLPSGKQYRIVNYNAGLITVKNAAGTALNFLNAGYAVTLTCLSSGDAAGLWIQSDSCSTFGIAASAAKLAASPKINGVSFAGNADVAVTTAGDGISVTGTEVAIDPSVVLQNEGGAAGMWFGAESALPATGTAGVLYVTS